jgi:hypothetical protein
VGDLSHAPAARSADRTQRRRPDRPRASFVASPPPTKLGACRARAADTAVIPERAEGSPMRQPILSRPIRRTRNVSSIASASKPRIRAPIVCRLALRSRRPCAPGWYPGGRRRSLSRHGPFSPATTNPSSRATGPACRRYGPRLGARESQKPTRPRGDPTERAHGTARGHPDPHPASNFGLPHCLCESVVRQPPSVALSSRGAPKLAALRGAAASACPPLRHGSRRALTAWRATAPPPIGVTLGTPI